MTILIVGGGKMGLSHFTIANRLLGFGQVAICDSSWATRYFYKKLKFKAYPSLEAAFEADQQISGVVVATPTSSHYSIALKAIERSIPCFIEKPLTLNVEQSGHLCEMARARNLDVQMGFVLRYVHTFSHLRDLVHSGALGAAINYKVRMNGNVVTKPDTKSWRTNFSAGGGCLNEYGPHLIDLCRFIFGEVTNLKEAVKEQVHSTQADDRIAFDWIHSSGLSGQVSMDWCDATKRKSVMEFVVDFEYAQVTADNSALKISFKDPTPLSPEQRAQLTRPHMPPRVSFYLRGEEYTLQLEDFLERCLNKKLRVDNEFGISNRALIHDGVAVDVLIRSIATKAGML